MLSRHKIIKRVPIANICDLFVHVVVDAFPVCAMPASPRKPVLLPLACSLSTLFISIRLPSKNFRNQPFNGFTIPK